MKLIFGAALVVLSMLLLAGFMYYSAYLERRRIELESEKKKRNADLARAELRRLSVGQLVEHQNRVWREHVEKLKRGGSSG